MSSDDLYGTSGNDNLSGGSNSTEAWGYAGNDTISGNGGSDTLVGDGVGTQTYTQIFGKPAGQSQGAADWSGVTLKAYTGGVESGTIVYTAQGVGISGGADASGALSDEINFNPRTGKGQELCIGFAQPVAQATVTLSAFYKNEGGSNVNEGGYWVAYKNGEKVAEGKFVSDSSTGDYTLTINPGCEFDNLDIGATRYKQADGDTVWSNTSGDSSDFYVRSVSTQWQGLTPDAPGDDVLYGGDGNDKLYGDSNSTGTATGGNDSLYGGAGSDSLYGEKGNDLLDGGDSTDKIYGGAGNDTGLGGAGNDTMYGEDGDDSLDGGADHDKLYGGSGADTLIGGTGTDSLYGEAGDDVLVGSGADSIVGGDGNDTGVFSGTGASAMYDGGKGTDTLRLELTAAQYADAGIYAELKAYNTWLASNSNAATDSGATFTFTNLNIKAQDWEKAELFVDGVKKYWPGTEPPLFSGVNDVVDFNAILATDYLAGTQYDALDGNDNVILADNGTEAAQAGYDTTKTFNAGGGNDSVTGGALNDTVIGGAGNDTIDGGGGSDVLHGDGNLTTTTTTTLTGAGGLYDVTGATGISISLQNKGDGSVSYRNTFGYYLADASGNPISGGIVFASTYDTSGNTATINLNAVQLSGATKVGFFIIPNGFAQNSGLVDGTAVTFAQVGGKWTAFAGNTALKGTSHPAYFSNPALNPDGGYDHESDSSTAGNSNWEDLANGGDKDNNDVNMQIGVVKTVSVTASGGNDVIAGGEGNDTVHGEGGNDTVSGGAGSDAVYGGAGNDVGLFTAGQGGSDIYDGGTGTDTLRIELSAAQYANAGTFAELVAFGQFLTANSNAATDNGPTFNFASLNLSVQDWEGAELFVDGQPVQWPVQLPPLFTQNPDVVNLNNVTAGSYQDGTQYDALDGNDNVILAADATEAAQAGYDTSHAFKAGAGNDTVVGGSLNDTIEGGTGNDSLTGGEGNDVLRGNGGAPATGSALNLTTPASSTNVNTVLSAWASAGVTVEAFTTDGSGTYTAASFGTKDLAFQINHTHTSNTSVQGDYAYSGIAVSGGIDGGETDTGNGSHTDGGEVMRLTFANPMQSVTVTLSALFDGETTLTPDRGPYDAGYLEKVQWTAWGANGEVLTGIVEGTVNGLASFTVNPGWNVVKVEVTPLDDGAGHSGDNSDFLLHSVSGVQAGGSDNDVLAGGNGNDNLDGDEGNDTLDGGAGSDTVYGDSGNDVGVYHGESAVDFYDGGIGTDTIQIHLTSAQYANAATLAELAQFKLFLDANNNPATDSGAIFSFATLGLSAQDWEAGELYIDGVPVTWPVLPPLFTPGNDSVNFDNVVAGTYLPGSQYHALDGDDYVLLPFDATQAAEAGFDPHQAFYGGNGQDTVLGGALKDVIHGDAGDDVLYGSWNADALFGGAGNDLLYFSTDYVCPPGLTYFVSADDCSPAVGTAVSLDGLYLSYDVYNGGADVDTLVGSNGGDIIVLDNGNLPGPRIVDVEVIDGAEGNDLIDLSSLQYAYGDVTLLGGNGNDTIWSNVGNDRIEGGDGDDFLAGNLGDDTIFGGAGNDLAYGGSGNDLIIGDNVGDDTLTGTTTSAIVQFPDGRYDVSGAQNATIALENKGNSSAGYQNAFGYYLADASGNPISGVVVWDNQHNTVGQTYNAAFTAAQLAGVAYIGLFVIPNGDALNGALASNTPVTFQLVSGVWTAFVGATPLAGQDAPVLFSDPALNGGFDYEQDSTLPGNSNWEDIRNGGDFDFNDVNMQVDLTKTVGTPTSLDDTLYGDCGDDMIYGMYGDDLVYGGTGNDTIYTGVGDDTIHGDDGDDLLYGGGDDDSIYGGNGHDTIYGDNGLYGDDQIWGGTGNDLMFGQDGDDSIRGDDGDDSAYGGNGNDYIWGGTGNDTAFGEDGDDRIAGDDGDDLIYGGNGQDSLYGGIGNDTIHGEDGDDKLYQGEGADLAYGGNGDDSIWGAAGDDTQFGGAGNDQLVGDEGNDSLDGGEGDDQIYGMDGDDTLNGDAGNDYLAGGLGNDLAFGGEGMDWIGGGEGDDTSYGGAGDDAIYGWNGNDEIYGGDGDDVAVGDDGDDLIYSGTGNDGLYGKEGNDSLYGGLGADWMEGGAGNDLLYGGADNDVVAGGEGDDTVYADDGDDYAYGNEGNDLVFGGAGNDRVEGYDGNDTLHGDDGDDIVLGGGGDDTMYGGTGKDSLYGWSGADVAFGGDDDDLLVGDAGNDTLYGDAGNDAVYGGEGDDELFGGDGDDYVEGGEGNDAAYGGAGSDWIDGGAGNDSLAGGDGSDTLIGGEGNDELYGGTGADVAAGGAGDDTISGDDGDDALYGQDGDDFIYGGLGNDYAEGGAGNDALWGGEGADSLYGQDGDDVVFGGSGNDWIEGGLGNDSLFGGDGHDLIVAGEGADQVFGGAGDDLLAGNEGDDSLWGGAGNDWLYGQDGNDLVYGGAGEDHIEAGNGNDTVAGGQGADYIHGGTGDDVLMGDDGDLPGLAPVGEPRTNLYSLTGVVGSVVLTVSDLVSNAGYHNSYGWYLADADGNPLSGGIIWSDVVDSLGQTQTITLTPGQIGGAAYVGFFVVPDGANQNPALVDGAPVTFAQVGGEWTAFAGGNPLVGTGAPAFFVDPALNPAGFDYEIDNGVPGNSNWEDIVGGGDMDFDDVAVQVEVAAPGMGGNDTIIGGAGNDWIAGNGGDDVLVGDDGDSTPLAPVGGAATNLYSLAGVTGLVEVDVTDTGSNAGYQNSYGWYLADADGNPLAGGVFWSNVQNHVGETQYLTLNPADYAGASYLGFFVIPNGAGNNPGLTNGADVTFAEIDGKWTAMLNGDPLTGTGVPALFSDPLINPDQADYEQDNGAPGNSNWEDIYGGGDFDFDDVNVQVNTSQVLVNGGNDTLYGGEGHDSLYGNGGDDLLVGGAGNDLMYGGYGNDVLDGGDGCDTMNGGMGNDSYWFGRANAGTGPNEDWIVDTNGNNELYIYGDYAGKNAGTAGVGLGDLTWTKAGSAWTVSFANGDGALHFDPNAIDKISLIDGSGTTQVLFWNGTDYAVYDPTGTNYLGYTV